MTDCDTEGSGDDALSEGDDAGTESSIRAVKENPEA
jgi:hypothetical protein